MQIGPLTEDPEEQMNLGNTLSNCLYRKVEFQGRQQSRASNERGEISGKVTTTSTFNALHQLN